MEETTEEQDAETTPTTEEAGQSAPPPERKTNYQTVVVTEVESCCHFWAQLADQGTFIHVHVALVLFIALQFPNLSQLLRSVSRCMHAFSERKYL